MTRAVPRLAATRRAGLAGVVVTVALGLTAGCGGGTSSAVDPSAAGSSSATSTSSASGTSSSSAAAPASSTIQVRAVRATASSPADSSELQAFNDLDCSHPVPTPPAQVATACDAQGHKYLLDPAAFTGGVTSAQAQSVASGGAGVDYVVAVHLDAPATTALARVTARLTQTHGLLALVLGGRVVAAPEVVSPITDGDLEIQVPGSSQAAAEALAAQLAP